MNTSQRITTFLYSHPEFLTEMASQFYAFSEKELEKYEDKINWDKISQNSAVGWNESLIRKFSHRLDWIAFSQNAVFAVTNLLEVFKDQIDWEGEVEDGFFYSVASGNHIIWTSELIDKYQDRLNFNYLSMNEQVQWSEQLIEKYKDRWNWGNILMNDSIPWTLPLLKKFISCMDTSMFYFQFHPILTGQLDIVEKYWDLFCVNAICMNSNLPWKEKDLLTRWKDILDWRGLAGNTALFNDPQFFENNLDKWLNGPDDKFEILSGNQALPWSIQFLERFENRWDWEKLSQCSYLPWSAELIDRFATNWEWGGKCDGYITEDEDGNQLPVPIPISNCYSTGIVTNPHLPWTIDFILKYQYRLDLDQLAENEGVWEKMFKPFWDKNLLDMM
ncbi:hypothetical protein [Aquipluma nitroreducens]|nr:hypothetical protein [Aquipluma nitroreducens]